MLLHVSFQRPLFVKSMNYVAFHWSFPLVHTDEVTITGVLYSNWRPPFKDVRCDLELMFHANYLKYSFTFHSPFRLHNLYLARFHSSPDVAFILVSNVSLILNYFIELCLLTASRYYGSIKSITQIDIPLPHSHLAIGVWLRTRPC